MCVNLHDCYGSPLHLSPQGLHMWSCCRISSWLQVHLLSRNRYISPLLTSFAYLTFCKLPKAFSHRWQPLLSIVSHPNSWRLLLTGGQLIISLIRYICHNRERFWSGQGARMPLIISYISSDMTTIWELSCYLTLLKACIVPHKRVQRTTRGKFISIDHSLAEEGFPKSGDKSSRLRATTFDKQNCQMPMSPQLHNSQGFLLLRPGKSPRREKSYYWHMHSLASVPELYGKVTLISRILNNSQM